MKQRICSLLSATAVLISLAGSAAATTVIGGSLEELVQRADEVIRGTVLDVESEIRDGRIVTRVVVDAEVLYRSGGSGEVEIIVPGGRVGDLVTWVPGVESYSPGEEVVVLASARADGCFMSMGLALTKFTIERRPQGDFAVRDISGLHIVEAAPDAPRLVAPTQAPAVELTLETLDALLRHHEPGTAR